MWKPLLLACVGVGCTSEPAFDVAYSSEWEFSVAGPVSGYMVVVNTGESPLNLGTLHVSGESGGISVTAMPSSIVIAPGYAAGLLTPLSRAVLIDSSIVTEPLGANDPDLLNIEIQDFAEGRYDLNAAVDLSLDGITTTIPFVIRVVPGPIVYADPVAGSRVPVSR